ncbi:MAG TPA: NAD(P)-dependent oxidoreductase, partial [Nitrospiria bacterium]|nr:NAD(P)-dependent oxidoreductase [Nitrospiria bacterium]
MKDRVLVSCVQLQQTIEAYRETFQKNNIEIELPEVVQKLTEKQLLDIIDRFDGVIAGDDEFTAAVIHKAERLKVISKWGVGVDAIDREAAEERGIRVTNTPDAFSDELADLVMAYTVMLARNLLALDSGVRGNRWPRIRGASLRGKTIGTIGVGGIGKAVIRRAVAAGLEPVGNDVRPVSGDFVRETGIRLMSLEELLGCSDFISLNCDLNSKNRHLLGGREFRLMKKGVFIINTARGPLIDEPALISALKEGRVAGAALDVFEEEPLPESS